MLTISLAVGLIPNRSMRIRPPDLGDANNNDQSYASNSNPFVAKENQQPANSIQNWNQKQPPRVSAQVAKDDWDYLYICSTTIFALMLVIVGFLQARVMHWTYTAEQRPKLVLHYLALIKPEEMFVVNESGNISNLTPIYATLAFTNIGGSTAVVIEGNVTLRQTGSDDIGSIIRDRTTWPPLDKITGLPEYSTDRSALVGTKFPPGKREVVQFALPPTESIREMVHVFLTIARGQNMKHLAFFVYGYIRYRDWTRRTYVLAFCRRFDAEGDCFLPVRDKRYEYNY
jgi:hypothetical protein